MKQLRIDHDDSVARKHAQSPRLVRILRLLALVSGSELYDADRLVSELRVTCRIVYRDLEILRASGVDIRFDSESRSLHSISPSEMRPILDVEDVLILAIAAQVSPLALNTNTSRSIRSAVACLTGTLSKPAKH